MNKRVSKALGEKFTFTLKNNTGTTKTVAILAAFFNTLKVVNIPLTPRVCVQIYP